MSVNDLKRVSENTQLDNLAEEASDKVSRLNKKLRKWQLIGVSSLLVFLILLFIGVYRYLQPKELSPTPEPVTQPIAEEPMQPIEPIEPHIPIESVTAKISIDLDLDKMNYNTYLEAFKKASGNQDSKDNASYTADKELLAKYSELINLSPIYKVSAMTNKKYEDESEIKADIYEGKIYDYEHIEGLDSYEFNTNGVSAYSEQERLERAPKTFILAFRGDKVDLKDEQVLKDIADKFVEGLKEIPSNLWLTVVSDSDNKEALLKSLRESINIEDSEIEYLDMVSTKQETTFKTNDEPISILSITVNNIILPRDMVVQYTETEIEYPDGYMN